MSVLNHSIIKHIYFLLMYHRTDDIQDNSVLRRGIPVAHSIYGVASTINAANYMSFVALERTLSLGHPMVCYLVILHNNIII